MGRPKSTYNPEKDDYVRHARESKVTAEVLAAVLDGAHNYKNPVIRLSVTDAVLHLEEELRQARQGAVMELRELGRSWPEIGKVLGVSRQRAWQLGNGR